MTANPSTSRMAPCLRLSLTSAHNCVQAAFRTGIPHCSVHPRLYQGCPWRRSANSDVPPSPPQSQLRLLRLHQTRHLLVVLFLPASVHTSPNTIFQASKLEGESIVSLCLSPIFRARYGPRDVHHLLGRQAELRQSARNLNWRQLKAAREKRSKRKKQLSDHRVDTCVALAVPAILTRIFMNPASTSDTEEDDAGNLYRMHVPWRSQELTQFAHKLDEATVERLRKQKGVRYVQRAKLLELRRRNPVNTPRVVPVPVSFPQNCYSPIPPI
ncbi:hypothetical protein PSHT_09310 [Puccinia striiformis]|uniref:Uncharacterized protein n=1 Tax=Puccinia striiformis TaxID=27350 RepID=A0A2S4VHS9_9BASI|nr:hypothetical protein PSHT_09310 [Puccinia striiformis]